MTGFSPVRRHSMRSSGANDPPHVVRRHRGLALGGVGCEADILRFLRPPAGNAAGQAERRLGAEGPTGGVTGCAVVPRSGPVVAAPITGLVGTWGTYVVSAGHRPSGELAEEVELRGGWHRYLVREPVPVTGAAALSAAGPVVMATVMDSDYCELAAAVGGRVLWNWSFGQAPWSDDHGEGEYADPPSSTDAAKRTVTGIIEWASASRLVIPDRDSLLDALDQGYVFAEEGLFKLLDELGLVPDVQAVSEAPPMSMRSRPAPIVYDTPNRWTLLQVNTRVDLFDHLEAVAGWLEQARQRIVQPLMKNFDNSLLITSMDPHQQFEGPPNGLVVLSSGWSMKGRPVFGAGDDAGWARKLRQLSRRELREVRLEATALNSAGRRRLDSPGTVEVVAEIRDQFSTGLSAPLPDDHPGQLFVRIRDRVLDRIPAFDQEAEMHRLAVLAINTIPQCSAFIEPERPMVSEITHLTPVTSTLWSSSDTEHTEHTD